MKLPNVEHAVVSKRKIVEYLLSDSHPHGRHKARFFRAIGFTVNEWQQLAQALLEHAERHDVVSNEITLLGERFVIDGIIDSPIGKSAMIRASWFIDTGESIPRFITAFPLRGGFT